MAVTKAKLIADGVITVDNLNASHGITTTHIGEGEKLFYTDARVGSYLAANNYITTAGGYFSDASLSANILTFQKSDGTTDSVDLSLYLDDTNLARLVSGTLDGLTGIATFTRDDSSTFTIDFSAFLADANDYVSSGSFNTTTGVLTLTRLGGSTVTVDLDGKYAEASHTHLWADITDAPTALSFFTNDSGFLTSFTETDPVYVASSWYTTTNNSADWDTAYGWGDHSLAGYLTSFTETDPVFTASAASGITSTQITNWDTAYGWGDHAAAGYLTSLPSHNHDTLYVPLSRTITINGTALDLSADRSFTISASDADTLDGIDSSQFVRNDVARAQVAGYMDIADVTSGSFRIYDGTTFRGGFGTSRWSDGVTAVDQMSIFSVGDGINFYTGNSNAIRATINSDYLYHVSDVRAPIFYDSDNTGYYLDPASTSRINTIYFDTLRNPSGNWILGQQGTNHFSLGSSAVADTLDLDVTYITQKSAVTLTDTSYYRGSPTYGFRFNSNADTINALIVNNSGDSIAYSSHRAPIFYDSNNTGYYLDPASSGVSLKINGGVVTTAPSGSVLLEHQVSEANAWIFKENATNWGLYWFNHGGASGQGIGGYTTVGAELFGMNAAVTGFNPPETWAGVDENTRAAWMLSNYSGYFWSQGTQYSETDMRAPLFYDANNTGYYVDPASTSNLAGLTVANTITGSISGSAGSVAWGNVSSKPAGWLNETNLIQGNEPNTNVPSGFYESYLGAGNPTGTWFNYINVRHSNPGNGHGYQLGMSYYDNNLWFRSYQGGIPSTYQSWEQALATGGSHQIKSGILQSNASMRSPLFYDSDNTAYYFDGAGSSNLNSINYVGQIRNSGSGYKSYNLHGMVGDYDQNSTSDKIIWTIGDSWNSIGGMYGIGYSYGSGYGHHLVFRNNGTIYHRISFAGEGAYFTGTITASGDIVAFSDERTKENVKTIDNALDKVLSLRGVEFNKIGETNKSIGVIAQEVEKVLPEVVKEHEMDGMKTVAYGNIVSVLIEAIKEQQQQINELKKLLNL